MNLNEVIKYPILTEKSYSQMENKIYTFAVDFRTNKSEVKKVVEYIFDVKVDKVNIQTIQKKPKKVGKFQGFTNRYKKAIVTLSKGSINMFPNEKQQETNNEELNKEETEKILKNKEETEKIEKRAAEKIAQKKLLKNKEETEKIEKEELKKDK